MVYGGGEFGALVWGDAIGKVVVQTIVHIVLAVVGLVAIGIALWLSLWIIGIFLLVGGGLVLFYTARQFLIDKGILNPTPGVPMDSSDGGEVNVTVIETTYTKTDTKADNT